MRMAIRGVVTPPSFAMSGHYSSPVGSKLIELPLEKLNIGKDFFQQNSSSSEFIKKKKVYTNVAER